MSVGQNLDRSLDPAEPGPEERDLDRTVDASPEDREGLEEALPVQDDEAGDDQAEDTVPASDPPARGGTT